MALENLAHVQERIQSILNRFESRPPRAGGLEQQANPPADSSNRKDFATQLDELIEKESMQEGVDPNLIRAVIRAESGGKTNSISSKGALGLMQLMPETARLLNVDPKNPRENIKGGIQYLKQMAQKFGDLDKTLAAYNAGPGAVEKYKGIPPYKETQEYVKKIRRYLNEEAEHKNSSFAIHR